MKIIVIGGDGFCGWPTSLHLSNLGHDVMIIDNLIRRKIDIDLGVKSLTPISTIEQRLTAWKNVYGKEILFQNLDVSVDVEALRNAVRSFKPNVIIHFGEQRAAPYSMKDYKTRLYTVTNNLGSTTNILNSIADLDPSIHLVHLGTMGVYGYNGSGHEIPEGYIDATLHFEGGDVRDKITYPPNPGSVYHATKVMDAQLFKFYAANSNLKITDLHQGIVWGTQTELTRVDPKLMNRFDYDGDFGTVLNRFLIQSAIKYPLTVHGTGGQTRAFINIQDTCKCIELAISNPPDELGEVKIRNQISETQSVISLANIISEMTGAEINFLDNPRNEASSNTLIVSNKSFRDIGFNPITIKNDLIREITESVVPYVDRINLEKIIAKSKW